MEVEVERPGGRQLFSCSVQQAFCQVPDLLEHRRSTKAVLYSRRKPMKLRRKRPTRQRHPAEEVDYTLKTCDVTALLAVFVKLHRIFSDEADQQLLAHIPNAQFWSDNPPYTDYQLSAGRDSSGNNVVLGQSQLPAKVVGNELWVFGNNENHQQVEAALKRCSEHGFEQISVAVRYLTVSVKDLDELGIDWKSADACDEAELKRLKEAVEPTAQQKLESLDLSALATKPERDDCSQPYTAPTSTVAQLPNAVDVRAITKVKPFVDPANVPDPSGSVQLAAFEAAVRDCVDGKNPIPETSIPTAYDIIDQAKTLELLERCQKNLRTSILQAPRVTMWNRQSAWISDINYRSFVTGQKQVDASDGSSKTFEPQIKILKAGSTLRMRSILRQHDVTEMLLSLNLSDVTRVDTISFSDGTGADLTVQQPVYLSQTMNVKAWVPNGSSIIMKSELPVADNSETVLLFVATCLVMNTQSTERLRAEWDSQINKIDEKLATEAEERRRGAVAPWPRQQLGRALSPLLSHLLTSVACS